MSKRQVWVVEGLNSLGEWEATQSAHFMQEAAIRASAEFSSYADRKYRVAKYVPEESKR